MKTAAVFIDTWKLPIFEKHLSEAGYSYTLQPGGHKDVLQLAVHYEWVAKLKPIIEAAQLECANTKAAKP